MLQLLLMKLQLGRLKQFVTSNLSHLLNMLQPAPGQVEFLPCLWQDQKGLGSPV